LPPIHGRVPEHAGIAEQVRALADRLEQEHSVVVGRSAVELDGRRESIRRTESNLGNLVCDLARELTGSGVALLNADRFRASIGAGDVRVRDVHQALPFGGELVTGRLTGAQVLAALHRSASLERADDPGGFLRVSGLRHAIRAGRAEAVHIAGRPLDPEARYWVGLPDFLPEGGDGYGMPKALEGRVATGRLVSVMVVEAFRSRSVIDPAMALAGPGSRRRQEVTDVVIRLVPDLDVEAGVAGYLEGFTHLERLPLVLALKAHAAASRHRLHPLRRRGLEGQRGRQDHAHGLPRAVGQLHRMGDALAVEVDVGLLEYRDVLDLGHGVNPG
jgi:hypothetical protein